MQGLIRTQSTYQNIISLQDMFQKATANYAYRLLQLQMTIDETGLSIGRTKKQDISQLIQLYMVFNYQHKIGVEVLESTGDSRFGYFRTKLHDLMLKKEVVRELKFTTPEDIIKKEKTIRENKRKEIQTKLAKNQQQQVKQVNSIISSATTTVQNYKQSIQNTLKKQQNQIKQRLSSRNKRPQSGSSIPKSKPMGLSTGASWANYNSTTATSSPVGEYYGGSPPQVPKVKREVNGSDFKVTAVEGIGEKEQASPPRLMKPPLFPKKTDGI